MNYDCEIHIDTVVELAKVSQQKKLKVDVMGLKNLYYQQHKRLNGTGRFFKGQEYYRFMNERYLYIEHNINCIIEEVIKYKKKIESR